MSIPPIERLRREWTIAVVGGDTDLSFSDWSEGREGRSPDPHEPPYLNTNDDGVFVFFRIGDDGSTPSMEVVPMAPSGNVEFTIGGAAMFSLHHLDRMDMVRALLHDFHYSPERGGPHDQD